jgi:glutamate transport system permease protein
MLPVLITQLVTLLKETALGYVISYEDLLAFGKSIGSVSKWEYPILPAAFVVAAAFIIINLGIGRLAHAVERRINRQQPATGR